MSGKQAGKKRKLKRTFVKFLLSYLLILMVPLLLCSFIYVNVAQVIREQENHSRIAMLKQVSYDIETKLQELITMATNIATNQSVQAFLPAKRQMTEDSRYLAFNVINNIQPYRNSNKFVTDFYIYFKNSDTIINTSNMSSPEFFYTSMYHYGGLTFDQWYGGFLREKPDAGYIPVMDVTSQNATKKMITFMQPIPITEKNSPSAMLYMLVEEDKIRNMVGSLSAEGSIHILDKDGKILFESENSSLMDEIDLKAAKDTVFYQESNGKKHAVTILESGETRLKFIYIAPQSVFMEKANNIQKTAISYVVLCFIAGLVLVYLMAFRSYSPIKQIVKTISDLQENKSTVYENELEFIKKSVTRVYNKNTQLEQSYHKINQENEKFMEKFSRNMHSLKNSFINDLMKGTISDEEIVGSLMTFYDMKMTSDRYVVVLFQIDKHTLPEKENARELDNICRLISSTIELLPDKMKGFMTEMDHDMVGLLVNLPMDSQPDRVLKQLTDISQKIQECIHAYQKISLTAGIGDIQNGIWGISLSYKQGLHALDYKIIEGCMKVILYREIQSVNRENRNNYYYPIQVEMQLLNSVKAGDINQCELLLRSIYNENRRMDAKLARCLLYNIFCTVLKTLEDIGIKYSEIPDIDTDPVDMIVQCESLNEINGKVLELFRSLCNYINGKNLAKNTELRDQIVQYIQDNLCRNLSQADIAEAFGITPQYLSKFFKLSTGQNMVDYINQLKVEKVKALLEDNAFSISDIAEEVGFGSIRSLDRVFKNYEGITPGKYREMNARMAQSAGAADTVLRHSLES